MEGLRNLIISSNIEISIILRLYGVFSNIMSHSVSTYSALRAAGVDDTVAKFAAETIDKARASRGSVAMDKIERATFDARAEQRYGANFQDTNALVARAIVRAGAAHGDTLKRVMDEAGPEVGMLAYSTLANAERNRV